LLLFIIPSIVISITLITATTFIITANKISSLQYQLLDDDVGHIIARIESDYKTIDALGMANVAFYSDATKKGVLQGIREHIAARTSVAVFNAKTNAMIFSVGEDAQKIQMSVAAIQDLVMRQYGQREYEEKLASGENVKLMTAFAIYPNWDWLVVTFANKNQLFRYISEAIAYSLLIAGVFLIFVCFVVYRLSDGITRAIVALEKGAQQLSVADMAVEIDIDVKGDGEFSSLANSFNTMAAEIKLSHNQLKRSITEEKKTNLSLQESRKQYFDLVERTSDLITRVDLHGRFIFVNDAAATVFGLAVKDCITRDAFGFIHPDDRDATSQAFSSWVKGGNIPLQYENRQVSAGGVIRNMMWSIRSERDENGDICGFACSARDVTEQRRIESEREKLEKQLFQSQKMDAVGQLAGGIAHDFNNMLGVIIGHAELAQLQLDPSNPAMSYLKAIQKAGIHSAELTRQLLTFARKQAIEPKVINLNASVMTMFAMLQRLIGENINLSFEQEQALWSVKVDPFQVDQVLVNLCVNARDAIDEIGSIVIIVKNCRIDGVTNSAQSSVQPVVVPPGDYVLLSVKDDGCGMERAVMERIFEPFFTTKAVGKGTGLGLATVFGAVNQNEGFIQVSSELGQGTAVEIYFPRTVEVSPKSKELTQTSNHQGSETVLVVEDDEVLLDLEIAMLEQKGYKVLSASTVTLAETLAQDNAGQIALLLIDVIMPEMNGWDLSVKLKAVCPAIKVLFMSGYTADIIASQGIIENDVHFLQKPFSVEALAAKIRQVLAS